MIQVIAGKKGSGKTKRILEIANTAAQDSRHDIVFIDDNNDYMYDLRHEVRFVNASDYNLDSDKMFMGFLYGIISQNFDVGMICIDAFKHLVHNTLESTEWFFLRLDELSKAHEVNFIISIGTDPEELPEFITKFVI